MMNAATTQPAKQTITSVLDRAKEAEERAARAEEEVAELDSVVVDLNDTIKDLEGELENAYEQVNDARAERSRFRQELETILAHPSSAVAIATDALLPPPSHVPGTILRWESPRGMVEYNAYTEEWTVDGAVEGRMSGFLVELLICQMFTLAKVQGELAASYVERHANPTSTAADLRKGLHLVRDSKEHT